jgi:hypothetical protein
MNALIVFGSRLAEQFGYPNAEDLREAVNERKRRSLQPALDLRNVVFGDPGQARDDRLGLAFCLTVEPKPFAYPYFRLGAIDPPAESGGAASPIRVRQKVA